MRPAFAKRYDKFTAAMEETWLDDARQELLADVTGAVVEIGSGTGKNLRHYPESITELYLTEPTPVMRDQLRTRVSEQHRPFPVKIVDATADRLPLPDGSADVVVSTLVLCSVDLAATATELARVLRPGGELRIVEHVAADARRERRWQRRLDPLWSWLEGSCHLDHDTPAALEAAGFDVSGLVRSRPTGQPPLFRDVVQGIARRALIAARLGQDRHDRRSSIVDRPEIGVRSVRSSLRTSSCRHKTGDRPEIGVRSVRSSLRTSYEGV